MEMYQGKEKKRGYISFHHRAVRTEEMVIHLYTGGVC